MGIRWRRKSVSARSSRRVRVETYPRGRRGEVLGSEVDSLGNEDTDGNGELVEGDERSTDVGGRDLSLHHGDHHRDESDTGSSDDSSSDETGDVRDDCLDEGTDTEDGRSRDETASSTED